MADFVEPALPDFLKDAKITSSRPGNGRGSVGGDVPQWNWTLEKNGQQYTVNYDGGYVDITGPSGVRIATHDPRSDAELTRVARDPKTPRRERIDADNELLRRASSDEAKASPAVWAVSAMSDDDLRESIAGLEDAASSGIRSAQELVRDYENELVRRSKARKALAESSSSPASEFIASPGGEFIAEDDPNLGAATRLTDKVTTSGGFTYDPKTSTYAEHGFAVAVPGNSKIIAGKDWADRATAVNAILEYLDEHEEEFYANPRLRIGGWHDTEHDEVVLDLSEIFEDQIEAMKAGVDRDEQAIFDLDTSTEIPTGGTGGRADYLGLSSDVPLPPPFYVWKEESDG
jgi:hypothetical protein